MDPLEIILSSETLLMSICFFALLCYRTGLKHSLASRMKHMKVCCCECDRVPLTPNATLELVNEPMGTPHFPVQNVHIPQSEVSDSKV